MNTDIKKVGLVAIVGRPNVGKSTLLNALLGERIAIVSAKPQTTRDRLLGVLTGDDYQLLLVDTPGIHNATDPINRYMVNQAMTSTTDADVILVLSEVVTNRGVGLHSGDEFALEHIRRWAQTKPIVLGINKIDRLHGREALLPVMEHWNGMGFECIVPISASKKDGVHRLRDELIKRLPEGSPFYDADTLTDRGERFIVQELIREQVFRQTEQEIPYATAVEVNQFNDQRDSQPAQVTIHAEICVEREGQKAILIGKKGEKIKSLGIKARESIKEFLGCETHLKLNVRVVENWSTTKAGLRRFGYE